MPPILVDKDAHKAMLIGAKGEKHGMHPTLLQLMRAQPPHGLTTSNPG